MKQNIRNYFYQNRIEYLKVFLVFVIGIVVAVMFVNKSTNEQKSEIKNYIDEKIELVKINNYANKKEVLNNSLKRNIKNYLILMLLASSVIGIPIVYFAIAKKAFSIGYTTSCVMATQNTKTGIIFICNSVLLHNIIYIASMFIVLVSGVIFTKAILYEKKNFKFEIFRYICICLIGFIFTIFSSICESYVSINFLYLMKKYL